MTKYIAVIAFILLFVYHGLEAQGAAPKLYEDALLYKEFYQAAIQVQTDYYEWLIPRGSAKQHKYALYYAGIVYSEQSRWQDAVESFEKFAQHKEADDTDKALSEIRKGLCYYYQGKKALGIWQRYEETRNSEIASELGYAYARANIRLDKAKSLCQQAVNDESDSDQFKRNLAWVCFRQGDLSAAEDLLSKIDLISAQRVFEDRIKDPNGNEILERYKFYDPATLLLMSSLHISLAAEGDLETENAFAVGASLYEIGRYQDAIQAFMVARDSDFSFGNQMLTDISDTLTWKTSKEKQQWLKTFSGYLQKSDVRSISDALMQLSSKIMTQKRMLNVLVPGMSDRTMKARLQHIARAIDKSWASRSAISKWYSLRTKELKSGDRQAISASVKKLESDYDNAQIALQRGISYFANLMATPVWLGACYLKLDNLQELSGTWGGAKQEYATNPDFWSSLGAAYSKLAMDENDSETVHQVALKLFPDILGDDMDDQAIALAFCQKALSILGYDIEAVHNNEVASLDYSYFRNWGLVLERSGNYDKAKEALMKGRDEDNWNSMEANGALFFSQIVRSYYRYKEFTEVMIIWSELSKAYPAADQVYYIARLLNLIYGQGSSGSSS